MAERSDTIVAIATAGGRGGIGVIRLSGPRAALVAAQVFRPELPSPPPWPSHQLLYGKVLESADGPPIDDGFAVRMSPPRTYTGEEIVEISLHGSPVVLEAVVRVCVERGARLAEPGEFTRRAFLNSKLDLIQAEAVAELIQASTEAEARAARRRLDGGISSSLRKIHEGTVEVLAECEADVDFPEENLPLGERPLLERKLSEIVSTVKGVLGTYEANQRLSSGFEVAIYGRPNVGKSSLFNALLHFDRAIVTPIPGTTRDTLREELVLRGRRVRLTDTAGLRESATDVVEIIGVERTKTAVRGADLVLLVVEASLRDEEKEMLRGLKGQEVWIVWNKSDLSPPPPDFRPPQPLRTVSARSGTGIPELRSDLGAEAERRTTVSADGGISSDRQRGHLLEYLEALSRARTRLVEGASPELTAFELRQAHRILCRLMGRDIDVEEILSEIFSKFCIGK